MPSAVVTVEGLRPLLRELNTMGPEANRELRDTSQRVAQELARQIVRRARTPQEDALIPSVRARRDRVPKVLAGGTRRAAVTRPIRGRKAGSRSVQKRPASGLMIHGVEFGANGSWRFPRPRNADGYWIYRTYRNLAPWMLEEWTATLERVLARGGRHD